MLTKFITNLHLRNFVLFFLTLCILTTSIVIAQPAKVAFAVTEGGCIVLPKLWPPKAPSPWKTETFAAFLGELHDSGCDVGNTQIVKHFTSQYPTDLSDEDNMLLAAGLYLHTIETLQTIPGGISSDKLYQSLFGDLDDQQQARLNGINQGYFYKLLENTKERIQSDPEFTPSIKQTLDMFNMLDSMDSGGDIQARKPWYERWWGKLLIAVVTAVLINWGSDLCC